MLAPDVEEMLVAYLTAEMVPSVSTVMPPSPPLPFTLVNRLGGGDDLVSDYPTVSIHCFASTRTGASDAARVMHKAMKNLTAKQPIPISGGAYVGIDYIEVIETPAWQAYEDKEIWRFCGRYKVYLRINQTT